MGVEISGVRSDLEYTDHQPQEVSTQEGALKLPRLPLFRRAFGTLKSEGISKRYNLC